MKGRLGYYSWPVVEMGSRAMVIQTLDKGKLGDYCMHKILTNSAP